MLAQAHHSFLYAFVRATAPHLPHFGLLSDEQSIAWQGCASDLGKQPTSSCRLPAIATTNFSTFSPRFISGDSRASSASCGSANRAAQLLPRYRFFPARRRPGARCDTSDSCSRQTSCAMQHGWGVSSVPISLISDSYKASHYLQYPDCQKMVAVSSETS